MKVLYSTQSPAEYDGRFFYHNGAQTNYKRYLSLGDEMTILLERKNVAKPKMAKIDEDVNLVFVESLNSMKSMICNRSKNKRIIEEAVLNTDVCVVHLPDDKGNMVVKYAKKHRKPYLCVVCGCPWDALWNYDWRGKLIAPWAFLQLRRVIRNAPFIVYVTSKFLQHRYPTKGKWLACSNANASTGILGVLEKRLERIKNIVLGSTVIKIGTSAAIDVPYKGQEYVIRALAILKSRGFNYEYHLIGRGDDTRLKAIAKECGVENQVYFYGTLPHDKVFEFLDDIDVYIQPSKQEGLPRATIEAMSRGCLCLGSNIAGLPELIDEEYLFPKGNALRIAEILQNITIEAMTGQAQTNFERAKAYDKDYLSEKRQNFLSEFKKYYQLKCHEDCN